MFNEQNNQINVNDTNNDSFFYPPNKRMKCTFENTTSEDYDSKIFVYDENSNNKSSSSSSTRSSISSPFTNIQQQQQQQQQQRKQYACLRNLGSTCYINCIIQVMRYSPGFTLSIHRLAKQIDYLKSLNVDLEKEINNHNDSMFVKHLHELLIEMSDKEKLDRRPIYSPRKFVNTVWSSLNFWSDGSQQDAHEFLQYTVHFINECDLYLKKLHQQYQIKQLETIDTKINLKLKQQQQNTIINQENNKKIKENSNIISKSPGRRTRKQTQQQQDQEELIEEQSQIFKCKSTNSLPTTSQTPTLKLNNSSNYLRTPTKGGASISTTTTTTTTTANSDNNIIVTPQPLIQSEIQNNNIDCKTNDKYSCVNSNNLIKTEDNKDLYKPIINDKINIFEQITNNNNNNNNYIKQELKLSPLVIKLSPKKLNIRLTNIRTAPIDVNLSSSSSSSTTSKNTNETKRVYQTRSRSNSISTNNNDFIDYKLKDCFILLKRLDESKIKNGVCYLNEPKIEPKLPKLIIKIEHNKKSIVKTSPRIELKNSQQNVKKLKVKSKTFPEQQNLVNICNESIDAIIPINSNNLIYNNNNNNNNNINSQLNSFLNSNSSSNLTNLKSSRSKSRTTSLNENVMRIPSPAELLRKYSSIKGHICEMDKLFKGSSVTLTQCLACENLRKCPEAFYDRSLPVNTINNESMDLEWIMKCLSNESYLDEDSKYMCDICATKQEAKIYTQYTEMPNILVLHLLSYGITSSIDGNLNTQKVNSRSKLVTCFDCVCSECNNNFVHNNNSNSNNTIRHVFKLYAVVMHSGVSLNSGHYTAFINYQTINENICDIGDHSSKSSNFNSCSCSCSINTINSLNNSQIQNYNVSIDPPEWLHFDDTRVKLLSNTEFHRKIVDSNIDSPYILFYVKNTLDLGK